jgi:hypothetical protein
MQVPAMVPKNPGLPFTLPPAFNPPTSPTGASTGARPAAVDCIVR